VIVLGASGLAVSNYQSWSCIDWFCEQVPQASGWLYAPGSYASAANAECPDSGMLQADVVRVAPWGCWAPHYVWVWTEAGASVLAALGQVNIGYPTGTYAFCDGNTVVTDEPQVC
jgi:hypothetical protein